MDTFVYTHLLAMELQQNEFQHTPALGHETHLAHAHLSLRLSTCQKTKVSSLSHRSEMAISAVGKSTISLGKQEDKKVIT